MQLDFANSIYSRSSVRSCERSGALVKPEDLVIVPLTTGWNRSEGTPANKYKELLKRRAYNSIE